MREVLVLAPHPDDEVLGCGGTMARHAEVGDRVHVIVVTRGDPAVFSDESVWVVRKEAERAHAILGVASTRYLDFPAPRMDEIAGYRVAESIRQAMVQIRPDIVYLPHCGDIHHDHKAVFWATCVAARPSADVQVAQLLSYETLSETEWGPVPAGSPFTPTVYKDITPWLERKLEAASQYVSQIKRPPHPRSLQCLRALAQYRGATAGIDAAEGFVLVREVIR